MVQVRTRRNALWTVRSKIDGVTSTVVFLGALLVLSGAALQIGVWVGMFEITGGLLVLVAAAFRVLF